jgi:hypothetical protein
MLRFNASRAIGFAMALTLGTVATTSAQDAPRKSRSQLPVRKEQPATPTTETTSTSTTSTATTTTMGRDTLYVGRSDTTIVMCNCATTQSTSAGEVLPLIPARIQRFFGNGLYVGLGSGAMLPQGDLMNSYNPGWGVNVPIGWDPKASPLGVRVNLGYTSLNSASPSEIVSDAKVWNAALDAKLRVPFGRFIGATSGVYFVGGGSVNHFTNYNQSIYRSNNFVNTAFSTPANNAAVISSSANQSSGQTNLGIHGGVGLSLGVGPAELFAESRYERVYTPGRAINYVPIVAGVTFH